MYRIDIPQYTTIQNQLTGSIIDWMIAQGWEEGVEYSFTYKFCPWTQDDEVEQLCLNLNGEDYLQFHLVWNQQLQENWLSCDIVVWDRTHA